MSIRPQPIEFSSCIIPSRKLSWPALHQTHPRWRRTTSSRTSSWLRSTSRRPISLTPDATERPCTPVSRTSAMLRTIMTACSGGKPDPRGSRASPPFPAWWKTPARMTTAWVRMSSSITSTRPRFGTLSGRPRTTSCISRARNTRLSSSRRPTSELGTRGSATERRGSKQSVRSRMTGRP